ncbi:MAG TPA: TIGR01777 family oxidoreductase [Ignavibacteriaceae bacterium]|nr:TIGR01777 family oxidoreductase [Ignavibacteriaceae bacterium]
MSRKIIITGATGLIGSHLSKALTEKGYEIIVFTRDKEKNKQNAGSAKNYVEWDYHKPESWQNHINNCSGIIHLAGANLAGKRFTESYKRKVMDSRKISTENIVKAMSTVKNKPPVFICASGVNYYGDKGDLTLTEDSPSGNDFLSHVCAEWEAEAAKAESLGIRRVSVRTSPVLSVQGGVLEPLFPLFKFYLGAALGNGRQWFPWIHLDDLINVYIRVFEDDKFSGPVNAAAPDYVTMNDFAKQLGKAMHRPAFFKVPKFILRAAVGEAADFITASMKVVPKKLEVSGFKFEYPLLKDALNDILKKK